MRRGVGAFERAELYLLDLRYRHLPGLVLPRSVVLVGLTREDMSRPDRPELARLPLPRSVQARVVERLKACGASVICFDFYFPTPSGKDEDARLAAANRKAGNVLLPVFAERTDGMPVEYMPQGPVWITGPGFTLVRNIDLGAAGEGHVNVLRDADDRVRRAPALLAAPDGTLFPAMALRAVLAARGLSPDGLRYDGDLHLGELAIPLDARGTFYIRHLDYDRRVKGVLDEELDRGMERSWPEPILLYTFSQVLDGLPAKNEFAGKIVIVGCTVRDEDVDIHATPFGHKFGALVQAAAVHTFLSGQSLRRLPAVYTVGIVWALSLALLPFFLRQRLAHILAASVGSLLLTVGAAALLFAFPGVILDTVPCLAVVAGNAVAGLAVATARARTVVRARDLQIEAVRRAGESALSDRANAEKLLLSQAAAALGAPEGIFLAAEEDGSPGPRRAAIGLPAERVAAAMEAARALARETSAARFALSKRPADDVRLPPEARSFSSILCMPLAGAERVLGFLCLFGRSASPASPRARFTREDLRVAEALCRQAAIAMELKDAQQKLLESERLSALGKMTNMIVHDIKNPMQGIRTFAELVGDPVTTPEEHKEFSTMICGEIDRLVDMAQELLDFSRGTVRLDRRRVRMAAFVEQTLRPLRQEAEREGVALHTEVAENIEIELDPARMKRVLVNLCRNAIQALEGKGAVSLHGANENGRCALVVRDTGPGIPAEILDRVFEPFITAKKEGGTGLGLAIVKKIVEDHGGSIAARNREEGGAEFRIELPLTGPGARKA
jgi:signal transduction histidine kinase